MQRVSSEPPIISQTEVAGDLALKTIKRFGRADRYSTPKAGFADRQLKRRLINEEIKTYQISEVTSQEDKDSQTGAKGYPRSKSYTHIVDSHGKASSMSAADQKESDEIKRKVENGFVSWLSSMFSWDSRKYYR